ncbi:MAG TPA: RdgB/HAM1 family non-canonical purine NTP pyrophosphatase, partial [Bacteroidota bacterium]|nr:RdgB/HAM1 family non-canonical purine NTP pyrophosphatase [Bacteroidota bacterium]
EIRSLLDMPHLPEVIEDGATLEENALKKAREAYRATNLTVLSDDTGLEVFHLGMRPGAYSARYAGEGASYRDNYLKLLAELEGVPTAGRGARFRCIAVLIRDGLVQTAEGICGGTIVQAPRGVGGFGYDPVFMPEGLDETFAELSQEIKNRISHRAIAFRKMKQFLDIDP